MEIKDLIKKYNLNKNDVWDCHGSWILKHDAVTKIGTIENIKISKMESLLQTETESRFLITMVKEVNGIVKDMIITVGEASKLNCTSKYYGAMAEKRGIDRSILKLIKAYEYGIYSEEEADDFKKPKTSEVTIKQKNLITSLCIKNKLKQYDFAGMTSQDASFIITDLNQGGAR